MAGRQPGDDRDLYAVLGVPAAASAPEITRAYRRLVRALHPDTSPVGADVEANARRLAEVLHAYGVLGDPSRRAEYDRGRRPRSTRRAAPPRSDPTVTPGPWPSDPRTAPLRAGPVHVSPAGPGKPGYPASPAKPGYPAGRRRADPELPELLAWLEAVLGRRFR